MTSAKTNIEDQDGVTIHEHFDCSKERLWETISDPDELSTWLGGRCVLEPRVGGVVRFEVPDDGIIVAGTIRQWMPPDPARSLAGFEHTFVDQARPEALCVCGWWIIPANGGCDLRFTLEAVDGSDAIALAGPWARLSAALSRLAPEPRPTPVERAVESLRAARDILLISWVSEEIPRVLVEAGFSVISKNGPEPDNYGRAALFDHDLRFTRVDPPTHADLLHLDWTIGFQEHLAFAKAIGVRTFWYHSSKTMPPAPADVRGCWVTPGKSGRQRRAAEAAGMNYIDDHYIVDIARLL